MLEVDLCSKQNHKVLLVKNVAPNSRFTVQSSEYTKACENKIENSN